MRELKFRAWDKVDKRFCTLREFEPCVIQEEGKFRIHQGDSCDYIFMQYIGLKDSKGVEIYEGDIIKIIDKNTFKLYEYIEKSLIVRWDGCCYSIQNKIGDASIYHFIKKKNYSVEIIGNIHKELLNDTKK